MRMSYGLPSWSEEELAEARAIGGLAEWHRRTAFVNLRNQAVLQGLMEGANLATARIRAASQEERVRALVRVLDLVLGRAEPGIGRCGGADWR